MLPQRDLLQHRLGYRFADPALLTQALTHRSYANEQREATGIDNERLEFLGDAVLDLVISHRLLENCPDADEGELSRLRAELVSMPSLARMAQRLDLGACLLLGRGEVRSGGRDKESLQADGFEAVIGAIFLDGGYAAAAAVAGRLFAPNLQMTNGPGNEQDFKTRLQERLQAQRQRPEYRLTATHGPDHQRCYEVEVLVAGTVFGHGSGTTKKRAEQEAACRALQRLDGEGDV